jgi:cyanophycinase-like exopeptidase
MPEQGPLHWVDGNGWLVLSGGGDWQRGDTDIVDAQVLALANLDRPMVVLLSDGSLIEAEGILDHFSALGGRGGEAFVLSELEDEDLTSGRLLSVLEQAGVLYLGGGDPVALVQRLRNTPALRQIVGGFASFQGMLLVGVGAGAMALGAWVGAEDEAGHVDDVPGLNFVRSAIVAAHFTRTEEASVLQTLLQRHPGFVALGVPAGTALALGPRGEVKTWGTGEVTAIVRQEGAS